MKIRFNLIASILVAIVIQTSAEAQASRLKVGVLQKNSETKWILLGIESNSAHGATDLDFQQIGFQGEGLDHLDPKFLLEVTPHGVMSVRAFELEKKKLNLKEEETYLDNPQALPPKLLYVKKARESQFQRSIRKVLKFFGKSMGFPISTVTTLGSLPADQKENLKQLQASYLLEVINKALPPYDFFPEFKAALSSDPQEAEHFLHLLGEALLIRFNPKSAWAGLQVPEEQNGAFYRHWRIAQAGKRSENRGFFIRFASENGLPTVLMEEDFGFVLIDSTEELNDTSAEPIFRRKFIGLGSEGKTPKKLILESELDFSEEPLLPWYLVSFINPQGPLDLINFVASDALGQRLHGLSRTQLIEDLAGSLLPLSNWFVHGISSHIKNRAYQKADTRFLNRLPSYGAILALTETQAFESRNFHGINYQQFDRALQGLGIQTSLQETLRSAGRSRWTQSQLLNDVSALITKRTQQTSHLLKTSSWEQMHEQKRELLTQMKLYFGAESPTSRSSAYFQFPFASSNDSAELNADRAKKKSAIVFMIDGLRPDRFHAAVERGFFAYLGPLFTCSRGTELTSFTSRSLTLPSWATILSGHEQDTHGIRSNTPFSRITGRLTHDYLDPKRDILIPKNWTKNRAYQMLEENTGKKSDQVWLPSYFQKDEVVFNYMPITNGSLPMAGKVISAALDQLGAFFNDSGYVPSQIDRVSSEQLAQAIKNDRDGKLRLVMVWYSQVDVASHHNNRELPDAYRNIDQAADLILREARFHPHLKDATVFLISDHGHNGGYGPFDENSTIYQAQQKLEALDQGPFLANTDFNLVEFLAGEFRGYEQYPFVVASAESPEPRFYNGLQKKFKLRSSRSIYPRNRGPATALLDTSGDSLAQLYLRPSTSSDWNHRLSFFELTHFAHEKSKKVLNLIADLLELKILNLSTTDPGLTRHLLQLTEQHPVKLIAMPLVGDPARDSVEPLGASADTGTSTREPVLVIGRSPEPQSLKTALIFTRSTPGQADRFRYVVVKHFTQDPQGVVSAEVSTDPQDDPLHYIGEVDGAEDPSTWRTDRQWLTLTRDHPQPTAIFSLARTLTLAPRFNDSEDAELNHETKKNRRAEIPDFILLANPGFGFHSGAPMESDHGGLMREEVRNSFFISSLNPNEFTRHVRLDMPVFSRDFLPTILSFLGYPETQTHFLPADETQSISLKNQIDSANERTLSEMSP